MALLLFGKPASGLSAFELAQAAQGLAELTGQASGSGVLGRLRSGLGLDRLSVGSGTNANSPVSPRPAAVVAPASMSARGRAPPAISSRGVVQVDVLEHVKIEATSAPIPTRPRRREDGVITSLVELGARQARS